MSRYILVAGKSKVTEKTNVRLRTYEANMPKSFFGCNSAVNGPIYSK